MPFEKFYFSSLYEKPQEKTDDFSPLKGLEPELIEYLRKAPFSKKRAFEIEKITVEISRPDLKIKKLTAQEGAFFGAEYGKFTSGEFKLLDLIPKELENQKKRIEVAATSSQPSTFLFVAKTPAKENEESQLWSLKLSLIPEKDKVRATLEHCEKDLLKALGRESEIEDDVNGRPVPVDVIIFRYTCIKEKDTGLWVSKVATLLKKLNLWPQEHRPKFIVLRYDEDAREKADFSHPFIDDLLSLPLDRLIFLQKVEIAVNLPKKISPSFLFVQPAQEKIEVSKKTAIERVSDLGLAVANPVPLAVGTPGHFYFRFAGQKNLISAFGKVFTNLPHPEKENQHLVFFAFFGLDKEAFKEIRTNITKDTSYKLLLSQDPKEFEYNPDNIFLSEEEKQLKTVVVIDHDEKSGMQIRENISREIGNTEVLYESSYQQFFRKYLASSSSSRQPSAPSTAGDFYAESVGFLIGIENLEFQMALTPPEETSQLLGFEAAKLFSTQQGWMDLFDNEEARGLLQETIHVLPSSRRSKKVFELNNVNKDKRSVQAEFVLEENNKVVRITLSPAESDVTLQKVKSIESLDCIVIDQSLVPREFDPFIVGLQEAVKAKGLRCPPSGPAVIVLGTETVKNGTETYLDTKAYGLVQKPVETRRLMFMITQGITSPFSIYTFSNIGWKSDTLGGKLARKADLVELSEFGATIRMPQKLKTGSMFYLFGSIFNNAPDRNLCCRVYHSEEDDAEKGMFLNNVIFFGISDSFLKFTRAYIRDTYAAQKSKEGGS